MQALIDVRSLDRISSALETMASFFTEDGCREGRPEFLSQFLPRNINKRYACSVACESAQSRWSPKRK
jgi:hypothetical protein